MKREDEIVLRSSIINQLTVESMSDNQRKAARVMGMTEGQYCKWINDIKFPIDPLAGSTRPQSGKEMRSLAEWRKMEEANRLHKIEGC